MRQADPVYELAFCLFSHRIEDRFWQETLRNLAAHFGADGCVETTVVCVDRRRQWSQAGNVWKNAAVRTTLHRLATPVRRLRQRDGSSG